MVRESRDVSDVSICEDDKNRYIQNTDERNVASVADIKISNWTEEKNEAILTEFDNKNVLRISNRSTAGKHVNAFNIPRYVLSNRSFTDTNGPCIDFQ